MKFVPKALLVVFLLAVVFPAVGWMYARLPDRQLFGELVHHVHTAQPMVALTFDDGPSPGYTRQILDALDQYGVKATFFLVGEAVAAHPEQARRIVAAGHQVGNHSFTHQRMLLKSPSWVRDELDRTDRAIRAAGYSGEIMFRPPYGKKGAVLPWVLSDRGMRTVTWDLAPESELGPGASADEIARQVVDHARPGSIVLMHVMFASRAASLQAVPAIIEGLRARGFRLVTVDQLVRSQS